MKTFLLLVVFPFYAFAQQNAAVSTTEAEYVYLTKGYGPQVVEQAGDLKKGYQLEEIGTNKGYQYGSYLFNLDVLIREKEQQICAMLVRIKSDISGKKYYLCIPINNPDLTDRYYKELDALDGSLNREYAKLTTILLAGMLPAVAEMEKQLKK